MTLIYNGTARNDRLRIADILPFDHRIIVNGLAGNDEIVGAFLHDNSLFGGLGNDTLSGGAKANVLDGGDGNDVMSSWQSRSFNVLRGGAGTDILDGGFEGNRLDGGTGADRMTGGGGGDTYVVDHRNDQIIETYAPYFDNDPNPADRVEARISWTLGARLEHLTLVGQGNLAGTGNATSNQISGNSGANVLSGMAGNDILSGGAGNDRLLGGAGNDILDGGRGNDILTGGAGLDTLRVTGATSVQINLSNTAVQATGQGNDRITQIENLSAGSGNDRLTGNGLANVIGGNSGNDVLAGMAGADRLSGGAGNDRLIGGTGNDVLTGGLGADRFVFSVGSGRDDMADFQDGIDLIQLTQTTFAQIRIQASGSDTTVAFADAVVTLLDVAPSLIDATDFIFV